MAETFIQIIGWVDAPHRHRVFFELTQTCRQYKPLLSTTQPCRSDLPRCQCALSSIVAFACVAGCLGCDYDFGIGEKKMTMRIARFIILTSLCAAIVMPTASFARTYTQEEQERIKIITLQIEEIGLEIQILLKQLALRQLISAPPRYAPPLVPDNQPPKISFMRATVDAHTIGLEWTTDEPATSRVIYGDNPWLLPTATTSTFYIRDSILRLDHTMTIPGLAASTTYYYDIEATDAAGNAIDYGQLGTTTLIRPREQRPEILDIEARPGTTTATIFWKTDTKTTSKIYFGATYPLIATSQTARTNSDATLVSQHRTQLADLTASTTYYFILESADEYGNTATSGDFSFSTRQL